MRLTITVDGKVYEVDVEVSEPERPQPGYVPNVGHARVPAAASVPTGSPIVAPPGGNGASVVDESKVCRSPIAGVVVRVPVEVGQTIELNDTLLVLEAMKMETVITAPVAGRIAKVNASIGDAVQGGQVLVEFT